MTLTSKVTASRGVDAPASAVFAFLCDPSNHPETDGSGMLVDLVTPGVLKGVGDVFTMRMHNDVMGDYSIDNHVVEFDEEKRIAWEPVLSVASRKEDEQYVGQSMRHRWGYELEAVEPDSTLVTEFLDCSDSPEDFQEGMQEDLQGWVPAAMAASLEKIALQVRSPAT
jgi:hypothetical protein